MTTQRLLWGISAYFKGTGKIPVYFYKKTSSATSKLLCAGGESRTSAYRTDEKIPWLTGLFTKTGLVTSVPQCHSKMQPTTHVYACMHALTKLGTSLAFRGRYKLVIPLGSI